jgi:hypothetical protein
MKRTPLATPKLLVLSENFRTLCGWEIWLAADGENVEIAKLLAVNPVLIFHVKWPPPNWVLWLLK